MIIAYSGKYAGNGNGFDALFLKVQEKAFGCFPVKGGQLSAVVFKTAANQSSVHSNGFQILCPVHHGRNVQSRRSANAQYSDRGKTFPLHNGIGTLGGSQHSLPDLGAVNAGFFKNCMDSSKNSTVYILCGRLLYTGRHTKLIVNQNRVRIGAAYVYTKLIHYAFPPLQRSSSGI